MDPADSEKRGTHMSLKCIGIDIGGTSVKLGIFEEDGTLVKKWEVPTRKEEDGKYILGDIAASIRRTAKESGLKPFEYFQHLLEELPQIDRNDKEKLKRYLPYSDALPAYC